MAYKVITNCHVFGVQVTTNCRVFRVQVTTNCHVFRVQPRASPPGQENPVCQVPTCRRLTQTTATL